MRANMSRTNVPLSSPRGAAPAEGAIGLRCFPALARPSWKALLAGAPGGGIADAMLSLRSADRLVATISRAHEIEVYSYTLQRGPVLGALEAAARRGARVRIRLEGSPYPDRRGSLTGYNRGVVSALRQCGADARLLHDGTDRGPPMHAKGIVADGRLFLDDRNFNANDVILADTARADAAGLRDAAEGKPLPPNATMNFEKADAVKREAELIRSSRRADVMVVTESFGSGPVSAALDEIAKRGRSPRLIVSRSATGGDKNRAALAKLAADGVLVRVACDSEKFALVGARAWIGSANASATYPKGTVDWGVCTRGQTITAELRSRAQALWQRARPFKAQTAPVRCDR
jgi:hypothetical protein